MSKDDKMDAARYAKAIGWSIVGLFGTRPGVHQVVPCTDPEGEKFGFAKKWLEVITDKDLEKDEAFLNSLIDEKDDNLEKKPLFYHTLTLNLYLF